MSTSGSADFVLLADEYAARSRAGTRPALQEYLDHDPEHTGSSRVLRCPSRWRSPSHGCPIRLADKRARPIKELIAG